MRGQFVPRGALNHDDSQKHNRVRKGERRAHTNRHLDARDARVKEAQEHHHERTDGTRQHGDAISAQTENKPGLFLGWYS
jgi:hypothetical protein